MLLLSFASFSAVLFTPALPSLSEAFEVSDHLVPLTMTIYLVGYALGQLPYGPIGNRFGRRRAIFVGLDLAVIGSVICLFADGFWWFCSGRFIQALGAAAGFHSGLTMIADENTGAKTTKVLSLALISFAFVPGIGVAIGGWLTSQFGWRSCFAFLAFCSLLLNLASRSLPETAKSIDRNGLVLAKIGTHLRTQFTNRSLILHALLMGLCTSVVYVFATEAPYIGISQMGLEPKIYGIWTILPASGMAVGLFTAAFLAPRLSPRIGILSGILMALVSTLVLAGLFANDFYHPASLFLPMACAQFGFSLAYSYSSGTALSSAHEKAYASSALSFINMSIATIATLLVARISPLLPLEFAALVGAIMALQLILWLLLRPRMTHVDPKR
jgi:MFS family permease